MAHAEQSHLMAIKIQSETLVRFLGGPLQKSWFTMKTLIRLGHAHDCMLIHRSVRGMTMNVSPCCGQMTQMHVNCFSVPFSRFESLMANHCPLIKCFNFCLSDTEGRKLGVLQDLVSDVNL